MELKIAQRMRAKIKMGLQGVSGSGKTMSALLIGYGLYSDWSKIAVVDTENHSAELYAHLGNYNVLNIEAPFTPEKYSEAIHLCEREGIEVIILDSLTHEWEYLLDYHQSLPGNSFAAWGRVLPRHNSFIQALLQSPAHIISTIRTKSDYVLTDKNGKMVPQKVGTKSIQKEGLEFEFTLVFDLDIKNNASVSKDRTGLFCGKPELKPSIETGRRILEWCNAGKEATVDDVSKRINDVCSLTELLNLYKEQNPQFKEILRPEFEQRKRQLLINQNVIQTLSTQKINQNGTYK